MRAQLTPGEHPALLIVDGDSALHQAAAKLFPSYELVHADGEEAAIALLRRHEPAVVVIDLAHRIGALAGGSGATAHLDAGSGLQTEVTPEESDGGREGSHGRGLQTLQKLLSMTPSTRIIVLTEAGDRAQARRAIGLGAYDCITLPLDHADLKVAVEHALRVAELDIEDRRMNELHGGNSVTGIDTRDPAMLRSCRQIEKLAGGDDPLMLIGETGSGKQVLARALHGLSARREGRFVVLHCAAMPESLLESELFGVDQQGDDGQPSSGRLEQADGGTLYLGDIDALPLAIQTRLLRFVTSGTFERIGGRQAIAASVRIVCSSIRSRDAQVRHGAPPSPLLEHLSQIVVEVPPLRERSGDAALLAHLFLRTYRRQHGRDRLTLTESALSAIAAHGWAGNVRELEQSIRRAVLVAEGKAITAHDLGLPVPQQAPSLNLRRIRDEAERHAVLKVMAFSDGNVARAAELLGVSRPTLYDLLNRFGLR